MLLPYENSALKEVKLAISSIVFIVFVYCGLRKYRYLRICQRMYGTSGEKYGTLTSLVLLWLQASLATLTIRCTFTFLSDIAGD